MPELPEVETIVQELQKCLPGKMLASIKEYYKGTVRHSNRCSIMSTAKSGYDCLGIISKVTRRGKYIHIIFDNDYSILVHLRMTGKLIFSCDNPDFRVADSHFEDNYKDNESSVKHVRAILRFSDNTYLIFNDPRTFGKIDVLAANEVYSVFAKLGCEPLTEDLNVNYLINKFSSRKISIKKALLNQEIIAGIGNIYACEILYKSKILPSKPVNLLNKQEIAAIIKATKVTLCEAVKYNGTSISDYRRVDDKQGSFQNFLQIYGKKACPKTHSVIRVKVDGRSTYYCPLCQK